MGEGNSRMMLHGLEVGKIPAAALGCRQLGNYQNRHHGRFWGTGAEGGAVEMRLGGGTSIAGGERKLIVEVWAGSATGSDAMASHALLLLRRMVSEIR